MAKSNSFNKREVEKKKQEKRLQKQKRKDERKVNTGSGAFESMIAYVDQNGVITNTPPDLAKKQEIEIEDIVISTPKKEYVEDPILKGRVEFFNPDKGYGFIKQTGGGDKYFFHISSAPASISEGNMVTFELGRGQKGINAIKIELIGKTEQANKNQQLAENQETEHELQVDNTQQPL